MSTDRIEIPREAFLRVTGQLWKLAVAGLVLPWPAVMIGLWSFRRIGPDQPMNEFLMATAALASIAALMCLLLASVRCPNCSTRLVSDAFRHPDGLQAFTALLNARSCPRCGHHPASAEPAS